MSCDLHTPLWVFTAPPLIPLHTLGAYLHTPSNPAPDNRKNAPPLWQRCAFVSSFATFANLCRQKRCRRKTSHENAVFFIFYKEYSKNRAKKLRLEIIGSVILK